MELKPCPFCGKPAEMRTFKGQWRTVKAGGSFPEDAVSTSIWKGKTGRIKMRYIPTGYNPRCTDPSCVGRSQKYFWAEAEAAEAWNRRANDGT